MDSVKSFKERKRMDEARGKERREMFVKLCQTCLQGLFRQGKGETMKSPVQQDKQDLISKIKKFKRDYKRRPTVDDCKHHKMMAQSRIRSLFGSWNKALKSAGFSEAEIKARKEFDHGKRVYYEDQYERPQIIQDMLDEHKRIQMNIGK